MAGAWRAGVDAVASAGDANHDGLDDLAVLLENYYSCEDCDQGAGTHPFVIYGSRSARPLRISGSYARGFAVRQTRSGRTAGYTAPLTLGYVGVGSPGDFDGDGRDDLLVAGFESGQGTVMIYGRRHRGPGPRVVRIRPTDLSGNTAGPLGDVNGDGLADVLTTNENEDTIVVVLGRRRRAPIDTGPAAPRTWRIAIPSGQQASYVGRLGDVSGDHIDDFAVGASADVDQPPDTTYVVLGTRGKAPDRLDALGAGGITIR